MKNLLHSSRWLIAPALLLAFCSRGNAPSVIGPSATTPDAVVQAGLAGATAVGDVKVGAGALEFLNLAIWGFAGDPGTGGFVEPGGRYAIIPGVEVRLWASYVEGSPANPKFKVEWGDGSEPSASGCGACKATHKYAIPGLYTVRASLDDRVSTTVTRTFTLDGRGATPAPSPSPTPAMAAYQPKGLNPGDTYRLVFVTSGVRNGLSGSVADYNSFVDGFGETVIPGHDWRAVACTHDVDARDNTSTVPGTDPMAFAGIYRLDGARVATTYADLWDGAIENPINLDEATTPSANTAPLSVPAVWSGCSTNGLEYWNNPPGTYGLGAPNPLTIEGLADQVDGRWILWSHPTNTSPATSINDALHLYAISEVLTAR